jgi:hypothetical protein
MTMKKLSGHPLREKDRETIILMVRVVVVYPLGGRLQSGSQ